ncbi:MAG: VOC family protein [Pseudomonadota bacterium]
MTNETPPFIATPTPKPNYGPSPKPIEPSANPVPVGTRIGHVHLKVADRERSLAFYHGVLGFEVMARMGTRAAFLAVGGYHHQIALNTWSSAGGQPPAPGTTGLFHTAILYPERRDLAEALQRLMRASWQLDGTSDHGVSEALYLRDPDENGVELYWDKPQTAWPLDDDGHLQMTNTPLAVDELLSELA